MTKRGWNEDLAADLPWGRVLELGKKNGSAWSVDEVAFARDFVDQAPSDVLRCLQGFVDGCRRYVHSDPCDLISEEETEPHQKRRKQTDQAVDVGIHTRVVAALSLRGDRMWQQLSSLVVGDLVDFVQPLAFGGLRVVLPVGQFTGGEYCSAHGDEVYFSDESHRCLAVYRDDALQRRVGEGELVRAYESAVVGDAVFVADCDSHSVSVYPRVGGARLRRFGSYGRGAGELLYPRGLAALRGRVYVAEQDRFSVFTEDGVFDARCGDGQSVSHGVAVDAHEVFVACGDGCVRVFRADNLSVERLIGGGILQDPWDVCVFGGVLFVCDGDARCVVAFDVGTGRVVASLVGFDGDPCGVAVRADGTLFFTTEDSNRNWRLYAAQLL